MMSYRQLKNLRATFIIYIMFVCMQSNKLKIIMMRINDTMTIKWKNKNLL